MTTTIETPRTFSTNEVPNRASLLASAQVVVGGLTIDGCSVAPSLKAYVNGLWPKYGDDGRVGAETTASGFGEGSMTLDVGGRWWIGTRWGAAQLAPWGGIETRRYPFEDTVSCSITGLPLSLGPVLAADTGGSIAWHKIQSSLRTVGLLQASSASADSMPTFNSLRPRVALFGLVSAAHTGASATQIDRAILAESSWYGSAPHPSTSQNVVDSASHAMMEGFGQLRPNELDTDPLYVYKIAGVFFGIAVPAVGSGVSP